MWSRAASSTIFLSLWYDLTWDWTPVSQTIGKHSNYYATGPVKYWYTDTLLPYMSIIYLHYILWTLINPIKENGLPLKKTRSAWYLAETKTDADYIVDLVLLTNTPANSESLLHSLEQAARSICMNANKTEFIYFK